MNFLENKTVLVTGAGGTIGSELCRQVLGQGAKQLIAFDHSELALYQLERELKGRPQVVSVLGDVADETDVHCTLQYHTPDIVYHAAAYKHVRMCELNQSAAWRVNSYGTQLLLNAAKDRHVPAFVFISTDKAVRPTSVMGETKAFAEKCVLEMGYTVVRLGNVIGSTGSVIPLWRDQMDQGLPVTITDGQATRYFIPIGTAVWRIIQASEIAKGGEVFVPHMGEPQNIFEMAQRFGAKKFQFIGLQPGEKLHEVLFNGKPQPTEYGGIFRDAA